MAQVPDDPSYTHGSTGTEPGSPIDYQNGDAVDESEFDYFINTPFEKLKAILTHLRDLQDGTESVAVAESSNGGDAESYKGNDIDSNGDGIVDQADDADTLQSNSPSDLRVAVEDAATTILTSVTSINFGNGITATDDGDGTVTVSADTQADTHTDVSDDGTAVVSDVDDVNFGTGLNVLDDADNTVTVNDDQDAQTVKGNDIDTDGDGKVDSADSADQTKGPDGVLHAAGSLPRFADKSTGVSNTSEGDLFYNNADNSLYLNDGT